MRKGIKEERHEFTRTSLLNTAIEMVGLHGVSGFSMRALAREVGLSPATLYEYFKDKDELIKSIMNFGTEALASYLQSAFEQQSVREKLEQVCERYMAFADENPKIYLLMFTHLTSERESVMVPMPENTPYGSFVKIVERGIQTGELSVDDPELVEPVAFGLWSLVHGMIMLQLTHLRKFQNKITPGRSWIIKKHIDGISGWVPSSTHKTEE